MKKVRAKSDRHIAVANALRRISSFDRSQMLLWASRDGAAALQEAFDCLEPRRKGPHTRSEAYGDLLRNATELQEAQSLSDEQAAAAVLKKLQLGEKPGAVKIGEKQEEKETIRKRVIRDLRGQRTSARLADEEQTREAAAIKAERSAGAAVMRLAMARAAGCLKPFANKLPRIDPHYAAKLRRIPAKPVTRAELEGSMEEFKRIARSWRAPPNGKRDTRSVRRHEKLGSSADLVQPVAAFGWSTHMT